MFNKNETATILAALRAFQLRCPNKHHARSEFPDHFGGAEPLAMEEIDALCERINLGKVSSDIIVTVEGGVIQDIDFGENPTDAKIIVHDYDYDGEESDNLAKDENGDEHTVGVWRAKAHQ